MLGRRLSALEEIAAQVQRREIGELLVWWPEARDLTPAELEQAIDEYIRILQQLRAWKRAGLSERQVMQRFADDAGVSVEAFEREIAEASVEGTGA
jgi:hypothetical protein